MRMNTDVASAMHRKSGSGTPSTAGSSPTVPSVNWRHTVERYIQDANLSEDEQRVIQLDSLDDFVSDLQEVNISKLQQSRVNKYMQKLRPFLETLGRFSRALDVFANADPYGIFSLVWGSVRMVLVVARDLTSLYEDIIEFFAEMNDAVGRLTHYEKLFKTSKRFNSALCAVFEQILDFCFWLRSQFRSKTKVLTKVMFSNSIKKDAEMKISHFKTLCIRTEAEAQLAGRQQDDRFQKETLKSLKGIVQSRREDTQRTEGVLAHSLMRDFQNQLAPMSVREHLETIQRKRFEGTCTWVMSSKDFEYLLSEDITKSPQLTWITGNPGVGKTYLTGFLIQQLEKARQVAYYFCNTGDVSRRNVLSIWRTMAWQLLSRASTLVGEAMRLVGANEITTSIVKKLMRLVFQSNRACFLIIDGLDEYEPELQHEILDFLGDLSKEANVLIISRKSPNIERALQELEDTRRISRLRIQPNHTQKDIERFVQSEAARLKLEDPRLVTKVVHTISRKAQGMFLYAKLALNDFQQTDTDDERHAILDQLPEGIDSLYSRSMHNINNAKPSRRDRVLALLRWVIFSSRPLTLDELSIALAITPNEAAFRKSNQPNVEKLFFEFCTSLLELEEETGVLTLVHATTKEFLLSNFRDAPNFDEESSHAMLASTCLTYLNFDRGFVDRTGVETDKIPYEEEWPWFDYLHPPFFLHLEDYPFLEYSVINWIYHMVQTTRERTLTEYDENALGALKSLISSDERVLRWIELFHFMNEQDFELAHASRDVMDAWLLQSEDMKVKSIPKEERAQKDVDIQAIGDALETFAFSFNSFPLLDTSGADEKSKDFSIFFSASQLREFNREWDMLCSHLGFSAPRGIFRWRRHFRVEKSPRKPIHLAAYFNYSDFVEQQLDDGEDIELQDTQDRGPLDQACWGEALDVAKLLVKRGANVDRCPKFTFYDGSNPLISSVVGDATRQLRPRDYPLAKYMLGVGAKVEGTGTPLNPAHTMFDWFQEVPEELETLRLILDHASSLEEVLETPSPYTGMIPLAILTRNNLPKTTAMYLERHPEPGRFVNLTWGADGKTALHEACFHPRCLTGTALIANGADVNIRTRTSLLSPLHIAAMSQSDMLLPLLEAGASASAVDATNRTALHLAAVSNWTEGILKLLAHGANINAQDTDGNTPVDLATSSQCNDAIKTLWSAGGKLHTTNTYSSSGYYPASQSDIFHTCFLLKCAFRFRPTANDLAIHILDDSEYWLRQTVDSTQPMVVMVADCGRPHIQTKPVHGHASTPVRKIHYRITCKPHEGRFTPQFPTRRSWTWFDLGKRSPTSPANLAAATSATINVKTTAEPSTDVPCGEPAEAAPVALDTPCGPPPILHGHTCLAYNDIDLEDKEQIHEGSVYTSDPEASDTAMWLSKVQVGESICMIPMARWPERVNWVLSCKLEVYTSVLPAWEDVQVDGSGTGGLKSAWMP